jgi:hypothetical protein
VVSPTCGGVGRLVSRGFLGEDLPMGHREYLVEISTIQSIYVHAFKEP